jgi:micrococcal nuclease
MPVRPWRWALFSCAAALLCVGSAHQILAQVRPDEVRAEVRRLLETISRGDPAAAAALYVAQPGTATLGDGRISRGPAEVRRVFEEMARSGPVRIEVADSITVVPLGADAALAYFAYRWAQAAQPPALGAMTVVLVRTPSGWRIAHDHTSTLGDTGGASTRAEPVSAAGPSVPVRRTRECVVTRIVDGDTMDCRGVGRIRLIGMDAPERSQRPFGGQAAQALAALAPTGSTVHVEPDVEPRDRYGRTLGYLWREGVMINWRMIRQGWAILLTYPPNVQYVEWFTDAQRRARDERRGLWAEGGFDCAPADRRLGRCD